MAETIAGGGSHPTGGLLKPPQARRMGGASGRGTESTKSAAQNISNKASDWKMKFNVKTDWKMGKLSTRHVSKEGGARRSQRRSRGEGREESGAKDSRGPGAVVRGGKEDSRTRSTPEDWRIQNKKVTM